MLLDWIDQVDDLITIFSQYVKIFFLFTYIPLAVMCHKKPYLTRHNMGNANRSPGSCDNSHPLHRSGRIVAEKLSENKTMVEE